MHICRQCGLRDETPPYERKVTGYAEVKHTEPGTVGAPYHEHKRIRVLTSTLPACILLRVT